MASSFLDVCRFNPTLGGTTDWTYSSAVVGYQSPTAAGAVNGAVYSYRAESADLSQWEVGFGAYTSGTGVFARTTVLFNNLGTTAKITFSTVPQVAIVALGEDLLSFNSAQTLTTTQQAQVRNNLAAAGVVKKQVFTASGTYTPSANLLYAIIECLGAGGGGGGSAGNVAYILIAGGGGAGAYTRSYVSAATVGASKTVTIGAAGTAGAAGNNTGGTGGDTSVVTLCVAKGGFGGTGVSTGNGSPGGAGGQGSSGTGDVLGDGARGVSGFYQQYASVSNILNSAAGIGANSPYGGGGLPGGTNANTSAAAGNVGSGYGSGGGAGAANQIASNVAGAAGQPGLVIITEFCSA